jgi:hypothetical protein
MVDLKEEGLEATTPCLTAISRIKEEINLIWATTLIQEAIIKTYN